MKSTFSADDGSDQSKRLLLGRSAVNPVPFVEPLCVTSASAARMLGFTFLEFSELEGGDNWLLISMFSSSLVQSSSSSSSSKDRRLKSFVARQKLGGDDGKVLSSDSMVPVRTGVRIVSS